MPKLKPHDFQRDAVNRISRELRKADRARATMPCGTGKTLVGLLVRKRMKPKRTLIAAPSLALVKQLLDAYAGQGAVSRVLVVCSDDTTAKEARERYEIPSVTTDPQVIAKELRRKSGLVVFATYQSTPKIAEAYAIGRVPKFHLGIFDEAHRMAGTSDAFATALYDDQIPIAKRLFMTATPRVAKQSAKQRADAAGYTFASMDDERQFGREAFYMSFNEAIEQGHLTDYQVVVFLVKESEVHSLVDEDEDARELAKRVALVRAMGEHDLQKVLAYHRTVRQMHWFAETGLRKTFEASKATGVVDGELWSESLSGTDNATTRREVLNTFASLNGDHRAVLNNCQVLQEGVDCPAVDAVCLVDPRTQPVDIVQIIGRAIRKSPNKKVSTIVLPVFVPAEVENDVEQFVASSEFAPVLDVIAALRSHDERVQGWIGSPATFRKSIGSERSQIRFNFDVPEVLHGRLFDAISSRVVRKFREPMPLTEEIVWEWMQAYREKHGKWPTPYSEREPAPDGTTWATIETALQTGRRGLPGGSSLRKLRDRMTGNSRLLSENLIWRWMQEYRNVHGRWPAETSREPAPNGSSWKSIGSALRYGMRGLPGGSSLAKLREKMTGETEVVLSEKLIWSWMQQYHALHGNWPTQKSPSRCPDGTSWDAIEAALRDGFRGLPGGSSLFKLRQKMTGEIKSPLSEELIWRWMKRHYADHESWPTVDTKKRCPDGSTWAAVNQALAHGLRGLPGGSSIAKLRKKMLAKQAATGRQKR